MEALGSSSFDEEYWFTERQLWRDRLKTKIREMLASRGIDLDTYEEKYRRRFINAEIFLDENGYIDIDEWTTIGSTPTYEEAVSVFAIELKRRGMTVEEYEAKFFRPREGMA